MKLDFLKNFDFFVGVPDSQLKPLCDYLTATYGVGKNHLIAANEGTAVGLAAGYHLATGSVPVVYMQNSGEGNVVNPVASLMNDKVYGIPCLFIIGWRGEPNVHDEPQHIYQGEVTLKLLEDMDIAYFVVDKDTKEDELTDKLKAWESLFAKGKQAALVVKKGALVFDGKVNYQNANTMFREEIIRRVSLAATGDVIVSTTGKASRELFEIREQRGEGHGKDFLTVGSMGHASSIALGIALNKPNRRVWVIDGDGACLMHMGAMAVVGTEKPKNLVHIVINNGAHETVGGMPTVAGEIDLCGVAKACGYPKVLKAQTYEELDTVLAQVKNTDSLVFVQVLAALGARQNLGRPTTTAKQNKEDFMRELADLETTCV